MLAVTAAGDYNRDGIVDTADFVIWTLPAVVGCDAATQTVTLFNPWGINHGLRTLTWAQVQENFKYFDRTA